MDKDDQLILEAYCNIDKEESVSSDTTDFGCLMVFFDERTAEHVKSWSESNIPMEELADFGIEDEPHITCQYGFHDDVSIEEITEFCNLMKKPISATLGEVSRFKNQDYDVIKVDVDSPDLHELSDKIRDYFDGRITVTFPEYHPHMTLAYVKKGSLPHIDGNNMFNGKNHVFKDFVYSTAGMDERYDITKE